MDVVKRKDFLYDEERERMKKIQEQFGMKVENYEDAWDKGLFESRTGMLNKQSMDAPYKFHARWTWNEGDEFIYGYRKTTVSTRKRRNAKARKHKNKKYYRKARNYKDLTTPEVPEKIAQWRWERDEYAEMMWERGQAYYATCKGCLYPLAYRHMDNTDMALCYDCAKGLRDEAFVQEMIGENVE